MKQETLRIFLTAVLLFGTIMFTSCVSVEMATQTGDSWDRFSPLREDTITYDANGMPIRLWSKIDEPHHIPILSPIFRFAALFYENQQLRYVDNHYSYHISIYSDTCEAVTLDSVTVRNKRGKEIPFHIVNWAPRNLYGSFDTIAPNGMDTIAQIPCTISTGTFKNLMVKSPNRYKETLMVRIFLDRHRWWINTLDINFCLSVRGEQKHYQTKHKKKMYVAFGVPQ